MYLGVDELPRYSLNCAGIYGCELVKGKFEKEWVLKHEKVPAGVKIDLIVYL
jgi:hypothetical protein